jgi:hypothetical protein
MEAVACWVDMRVGARRKALECKKASMRRNAMQCSCSFEGLRSGLSSETGRQDVAMVVGVGGSEIGGDGG